MLDLPEYIPLQPFLDVSSFQPSDEKGLVYMVRKSYCCETCQYVRYHSHIECSALSQGEISRVALHRCLIASFRSVKKNLDLSNSIVDNIVVDWFYHYGEAAFHVEFIKFFRNHRIQNLDFYVQAKRKSVVCDIWSVSL